MRTKKLIFVGLLLLNLVSALHSEPDLTLAELDPSPENYKSALAALQIKDPLIQTVFSIDPARAIVSVKQLEFDPNSRSFLISKGTAGTEMIRQLQAEQSIQGLSLQPEMAWVNGACFAFHDESGQWFKMSRPIPPSISSFRILGENSVRELSYVRNRLLSNLEDASRRDQGSLLIRDVKEKLTDLEGHGKKEFSVAGERYSIEVTPSGLVKRLTVYTDGIVARVVVNNTATAISAMLDKLRESNGDVSSDLSLTETKLFQRLAGTPSFGMFLAPHAGHYIVISIDPQGPAYTAGLRKGDVITALNGNDVSGMKSPDLKMILSITDTIKFNFLRNGKQIQDITVIKKDYLPRH